ncbi:hypothetical protein ACIBJI_24305 [Nocardia sp. NPDC050408]|uniref:hypothetical protein n=1 Tax=Nocardia sp. NPDC050408 TaxID=3364319 RepID=UPI0037AE3B6C
MTVVHEDRESHGVETAGLEAPLLPSTGDVVHTPPRQSVLGGHVRRLKTIDIGIHSGHIPSSAQQRRLSASPALCRLSLSFDEAEI